MKVAGKMIYSTVMEKKYGNTKNKLLINRTDGSKYEGFYECGKKVGIGHYLWSDGSSYYGYWNDNKIEGFGCYKWQDGRVMKILLINFEQYEG